MSGSICFTESMHGQVTGPAPCRGTVLELLDLQVVLSTRPAQGRGGMCGSIAAGRVRVPCLCSDVLEVWGGTVEILRQVSPHACEMRYLLQCRAPGSDRQFRLHGVKNVSHHSGLRWPRAIWVETTTLKLSVVELPDARQPDAPRAAPLRPWPGCTPSGRSRDLAPWMTHRSPSPCTTRTRACAKPPCPWPTTGPRWRRT